MLIQVYLTPEIFDLLLSGQWVGPIDLGTIADYGPNDVATIRLNRGE